MKMLVWLVAVVLIHGFAEAQDIKITHQQSGISFRGLSVVDDDVAWVSGTKGTVGRSTDGGITWTWLHVKGYEHIDFRDIEAFDEKRAIIMGIASPGYILNTIDGGLTWTKVYENTHPEVFMNAMAFADDKIGMVIGDPINGKMFLQKTLDGGNTWSSLPDNALPSTAHGEVMFASSGTNIQPISKKEFAIVTGGAIARIFIQQKAIKLPILQGGETSGANSLAVYDNNKNRFAKHMVIVGGDFNRDTLSFQNSAISNDGGKTWRNPKKPPYGYKSSVLYLTQNKLIACGLNGVDMSTDGGNTWSSISLQSFHVCQKAKMGSTVILAGREGTIGVLNY